MLYLELFSRSYLEKAPIVGVHIPRDLRYLQKLYIYNRDSLKHYYQSRNFAVKNTHILSRYLEHFAPYLSYDDFRYLDYVDVRATYLSKHFKFTSEIEKGIVHPPYFFGNNSEEIIISHNDISNPTNKSRNWKSNKALRFLRIFRDDTKLLLPLGKDDGTHTGLCVTLLDPISLTFSYREFYRRLSPQSEEELEGSKNTFIIRYILSNTLEDIIDHVFLNRIMNTFYGRENAQPKYKHRIKIFEPIKQLDRYAQETLDVITSKPLDFVNILNNIFLVFRLNAAELLMLPEISYTRQVKWALFLYLIDYMIFLYDVSKDKGRSKHIINDWKRFSQRMQQDKSLFDMLSFEESNKLKEKLYKISQM